MINLSKILLETHQYIENSYFYKYFDLINNIKITEGVFTNYHHIIPRHLLKNIQIDCEEDFIKNMNIGDHVLAHYYLLKCSLTKKEVYANVNALNLLLNTKHNRAYFEQLNDEEAKLISQARNCLVELIKKCNSEKNKGKIYIRKDNAVKKIYPYELPLWEEEGWEKGSLPFSEEHKQKLRKKKKPYSDDTKKKLKGRGKGYLNITKDGQIKRIPPEQLDEYLSEGWIRGGRKHTDEEKEYFSNLFKGRSISEKQKKQISDTLKGYIYMHKGEKEAHVYPCDYEKYLNDGWQKGRSTFVKNKISETERKKKE